MEDNEIASVIEIYVDEYNTLTQRVMYRYGDELGRMYEQSRINPNLTKLKTIRYVNKDWKIIKEENYV